LQWYGKAQKTVGAIYRTVSPNCQPACLEL